MLAFLRKFARWAFVVAVMVGTLLTASGRAQALPPVLTFVEAELNGPQGAEGLDGANAAAVSPDGLHVYVAGTASNGLAVFSRDSGTGDLTFLQVLLDGVGGADGLGGVIDVTVSPDGKHVYTASVTESAVAAFSRDALTGLLAFVGAKRETDADVTGLSQASSVLVSPDNLHVYATGRFSDGIVAFSRNTTTGVLTFLEAEIGGVGGVPTTVNGPDDLAISPNGTSLIVASGVANAVNVFTRSAGTGLLTYLESKVDGDGGVDGLGNVTQVAISSDGLNVYAAANGDSAVGVFTRTVATGALNYVEVEVNGLNGVTGLSGANAIVVSADGENVYASGVGSDAVVVFTRSGPNGALAHLETLFDGAGAGGGLDLPRGQALSPDGANLYVTASGDDALTAFTRDAADGSLTYLEHLVNVARIVGLEAAISVEISSDGNFVYVSSAAESAFATFRRDSATGAVSFVNSVKDFVTGGGGVQGLGGARGVAVSQNGANFYFIGSTDDAITAALRSISGGTFQGALATLFDNAGGVDGLDSPADVQVSPDDKHVYVVSAGADNAVTWFSRLNPNGGLTFLDTIEDGQDGANALAGATALDISANNESVYVAASGDHAVTLFSRNTVSGTLTFVEAKVDGAGGLTSLAGANDVAISPDQKNVYVTSLVDNAVTVFTRDLVTGTLTYVEHKTDSLASPTEVAVSPDGHFVFVTSQANDSLVVFERDASTGGLTFVEQVIDNTGDVNGLDQAAAVQVSPDGKHVYATGMADDALAVFALGDLYRLFMPLALR